jgi:hypothetical protein
LVFGFFFVHKALTAELQLTERHLVQEGAVTETKEERRKGKEKREEGKTDKNKQAEMRMNRRRKRVPPVEFADSRKDDIKVLFCALVRPRCEQSKNMSRREK